jgi:hypothetical protein
MDQWTAADCSLRRRSQVAGWLGTIMEYGVLGMSEGQEKKVKSSGRNSTKTNRRREQGWNEDQRRSLTGCGNSLLQGTDAKIKGLPRPVVGVTLGDHVRLVRTRKVKRSLRSHPRSLREQKFDCRCKGNLVRIAQCQLNHRSLAALRVEPGTHS